MADDSAVRRGYHLFADLVDYPRPGLARSAKECERLVSPTHPEAAALLREFAAFAAGTPLGRLEEIYSSAFDLGAMCYPYVGHYLFGPRHERSTFMLELKQRYRARGLDTGGELPDHLALVLRYLAVRDDAEPAEELIGEALLPALTKMMAQAEGHGRSGEDGSQPEPGKTGAARRGTRAYGRVLRALWLVLHRRLEGAGCAPEGECGHG